MDIQQITCQATGRTMKAERIYKIRNQEGCLESIVGICHTCPYANNGKNPTCKKCYGSIVQNTLRKINEETGRAKAIGVNYRNFYGQTEEGDYYDVMEAEEFLQLLDDNDMYIANLNNSNWCHGQRINDHLRGYDRPATWKTDCMNCKNRCHAKGELTACEKAVKYIEEQGINLDNAPSNKIMNETLPTECICQEQVQRCFYI